jgi:hypothetical protein
MIRQLPGSLSLQAAFRQLSGLPHPHIPPNPLCGSSFLINSPHSSAAQSNITRGRSMLCGRYAPSHAGEYSGSVLLSDVPCVEHFAENPLAAPCCRTRRRRRAKSRLREREATQGRHAVPTAAPRARAPPAPATALPQPLTEIDPTPEEARRRPTPPARSEAEPRTRTAARPPASPATRSRPPRPPPPPGQETTMDCNLYV